MANLVLLLYYIIALLVKLAKQSFWSEKKILSPRSISIIDVLESIMRVLCDGSSTDYKIKALITEASNIIISAKFGYCSKVPNNKYDQYIEKERAVYENEWLKNWCEKSSNIIKTCYVFSQVKQKFQNIFDLLSEVEQKNVTYTILIHDALIKINEWMMFQTDYEVSILVT